MGRSRISQGENCKNIDNEEYELIYKNISPNKYMQDGRNSRLNILQARYSISLNIKY